MLEQLNIKNIAIIDDLVIDFKEGFTVLTGETGAGKSIIVDGIGLLLGNRMNSSLIRTGCSKAYVEGCFRLSSFNMERLKDYVEDDLLIISKDLYADGRSITKVNGRVVPLSVLKEISSYIINIHSQFENQYLFDTSYQEMLLDVFAKDELFSPLNDYKEVYQKYLKNTEELERLKSIQYDEKLEVEIKNKIAEIEEVHLEEGELERLEEEQKRIQNFSKINENIKNTIEVIDEEKGALESLYYAKKYLSTISDDPLFSSYAEKLEELYNDTNEFISSLKKDFYSLNIDEDNLEYISNRISDINKLKKKYGNSYLEIEESKNDLKNQLEDLVNKAIRISVLEKERIEITKELEGKGNILSKIRKEKAKILEEKVKEQLKDLYLENVSIEYRFLKTDYKEKGFDSEEIYISFNKGEQLKPLAKVSSGGELSRMMLGLKGIFNKLFNLETIIFDEIDSGVSGRVAISVANKMKEMSKSLQVISITHLPNVAALADNHYQVSKTQKDDKTVTMIKVLENEDREKEIAKMIVGDNYNKEALETARKMLFK